MSTVKTLEVVRNERGLIKEELRYVCDYNIRAEKNLKKMLKAFVDPFVFGELQHPNDPDCHTFIYANSKDLLNRAAESNRWRSSRKTFAQYQMHRHITGGINRENLRWYTSRIVPFNDRHLCLLKLDIDFHAEGKSDASSLLKDLVSMLGNEYVYSEPSTRGNGIHAYVIVAFPKSYNSQTINEWRLGTQKAMGSFFARKGYKSILNEIRGNPSQRDGSKYLVFGQLAKLPRLLPNGAASAFTNLKYIEWNRFDCFAITASSLYGNTMGGHNVSSLISQPPSSSPQPKAERTAKPTKGDDAGRMFNLVCELFRDLQTAPQLEHVLTEYEARGLNTGPDKDGNRKRNAADAIAKVAASFKRGRTIQPLKHLPLIKSCITEDMIQQAYKAKGRHLTHEDVAVFLAMLHDDGVKFAIRETPKSYFLNRSRAWKAQGIYTRTFDNKKIAACKRLLLEAELIAQARKGFKGKGCDSYFVTKKALDFAKEVSADTYRKDKL